MDSKEPHAKPVVSAGGIATGMDVKIIAMPHCKECGELEEGEICIAGESVTRGYWNKDNQEVFYELDGRSFLRTGDLGFVYNGSLFVHGRLKDMLIIRGGDFYPYDIEQVVAESIAAVEPNGVAVFGVDDPGEAFVIVAEIKRTHIREIVIHEIIEAIDRATIDAAGIMAYDIVLTTPLGIPRTTSGKLQRLKCRDHYQQGIFQVLGSKLALAASGLQKPARETRIAVPAPEKKGDVAYDEKIRTYLLRLIEAKWGFLKTGLSQNNKDSQHAEHSLDINDTLDNMQLTTMGIDSLRAMELINTINNDLHINLNPVKVFQDNTLSGLVKYIENVLWLKNEQMSGEEIII